LQYEIIPSMFDSAPTPQDPPANAGAPDPTVVRAEERLAMLRELAEIGMELARALKPGAAPVAAAPDTQGKVRDPAAAFAPLSRAIRMTLALEARTDQELRDLKAGIVKGPEHERLQTVDGAQTTAEKAEAHKCRLGRLVQEAADADPTIDTEQAFCDLSEALDERLEHDEAYLECERRPLLETLQRLCADLGIDVDWSRWDGEGWIGPRIRPVWSVFNTPSRVPLLPDPGEAQPVPAPAPAEPVPHDLE
jgi:hypothetical protein